MLTPKAPKPIFPIARRGVRPLDSRGFRIADLLWMTLLAALLISWSRLETYFIRLLPGLPHAAWSDGTGIAFAIIYGFAGFLCARDGALARLLDDYDDLEEDYLAAGLRPGLFKLLPLPPIGLLLPTLCLLEVQERRNYVCGDDILTAAFLGNWFLVGSSILGILFAWLIPPIVEFAGRLSRRRNTGRDEVDSPVSTA